MNWQRIPKETTPLPTRGTTYSDWKPELAEEGFHQCVYCSISETSFGGIRNFHVEHYKPKGLKQFEHLETEFSNLYYACAICNTFKSDDWTDPADDFSIGCYPDPSKKNYGELFNVNTGTALVAGQNVTGTYILNKLYLNRPQLIINRKEVIAESTYQELIHTVNDQKDTLFTLAEQGNNEALPLLRDLVSAVQSLEAIFHAKESTNPYTSEQTKKPPSKKNGS
jgi:hypothetical protein